MGIDNYINKTTRNFIFCFIVFFYFFNLSADNGRKLDSLFTILKTSKIDTVKVNAHLKIVSTLMKEDTIKGMHEVNKLIYSINNLTNRSFAFKSLEKIGKICYSNDMLQKARYYYDFGLAKAKHEKNTEWQARFFMRIASYLQNEEFSKQCISFYDSALFVAKKTNESLLTEIYMQKGRAHYDIGDYKTAIDNYIQAQRLFEKNNLYNVSFGHLLHYIGSVFKRQNLKDKAIEYYEQELALARKLKNESLEAEALYLCAGIYGESGNIDKELEYELKALELYKTEGNQKAIALMLGNISSNYSDRKDYKKAISFCEEALTIYKDLGENEKESWVYRALGDYYSKLGQHQKALNYIKKALESAMKVETKQLLNRSDITQSLAYAYSRSGDYKFAFNSLREHIHLNDSLTNQSNQEYLHTLEKQYDTEKKEKEIALLNADKTLQQVELDKSNAIVEQQKTQRNALILGCVLIFIIAGISIAAFINKRKTSKTLSDQVNEINYQNEVIKERNKDITDSMQYAKRLQEAVFPQDSKLNEYFSESFILFKPKDIVSGDFYWFEDVDGLIIVIIGDCTGHGVPGAFMSILGHNLLNQIILEERITSPGRILNVLDKRISNALNKREGKEEHNDGMDMVICVIDKPNNQLTYAGANRPLIIRRNDELIELKPNKHAIGGIQDSTCKLFTQQELSLQSNDILYLFSDGYYDQFGGPKGKKLKYKQLTGSILAFASLSLEEQKIMLSTKLHSWQGNLEQVDDICVIGIKV